VRARALGGVGYMRAKRSPAPPALGRTIRLRRKGLDIPGKDRALELGYDQGWISHIENGRTNPAYGTVDRLARAEPLLVPSPGSSPSPSRSRPRTASLSTGPCGIRIKRVATMPYRTGFG
jgi:transcriptional regulator with XRE-family HTH domain